MKIKLFILSIISLILLITVAPNCKKTEEYVFFKNIQEGDVLSSSFLVQMGVYGKEVEPAGNFTKNTGHHHILVNRDFIPEGEVIISDKNHNHYGGGESEVTFELPPGEHKLTLQFADGLHRSYGKKMSATIQITVVADEKNKNY